MDANKGQNNGKKQPDEQIVFEQKIKQQQVDRDKKRAAEKELERERAGFAPGASFFEMSEDKDKKGKNEAIEGEIVAKKKEKKNVNQEKIVEEVSAESEQILEENLEKIGGQGSPWNKFLEELKEVLKQAGISPQQIYKGIGCLTGVIFITIVIVILARGGGEGNYIGTLGDKAGQMMEKVKEIISPEKRTKIARVKNDLKEIQVDRGEMIAAFLLGEEQFKAEEITVDTSLYSGLLVGETEDVFKSGEVNEIESGIKLGTVAKAEFSDMEEYIERLRQIKNALEVDIVYEMDHSEDRAKTLDENLTVMKRSWEESVLAMERISTEMVAIKNQYDDLKTTKDQKEKTFFDNLSLLSSEASNEALNETIELIKIMSELKARYNALAKIKAYMFPVITKMQTRITAIELNQEALIKGVKVTEVKGSDLDLDLIIR